MTELAPLAVSLGDPAGVGPELIAEAWARRGAEGLAPYFVTGAPELLAEAARVRGLAVPIVELFHPSEALGAFDHGLPVLLGIDGEYRPGAPDRSGAELALASLTEVAQLAVSGEASGIVTGPIAKSRLAEVGFSHPGQTEFVAAACGIAAEDAVMMLAGPSLRTVPLTVHVALAAVPGLITSELIVRRARIVGASLQRDFGIAQPRIAIAALNPHAGEDGRMGDEDAAVIVPAVKLPEVSRKTIVLTLFKLVAVVAEFATLPVVVIVANFVSVIVLAVISALTINDEVKLPEASL